ncbi:MAG: hypothetical protein IPL36_03835 [Nigerium sp.]|nr:hypothetical protein [Nigerium sp.]
MARGLLAGLEVDSGFRLLGVGVAGFAEAAQEELFEPDAESGAVVEERQAPPLVSRRREPSFAPGVDVEHAEHGRGWVWGVGLGRVTVRFETALSGPGPVRTFRIEDPALRLVDAASPVDDPSGPGWASEER